MTQRIALCLVALCTTLPAYADWSLDNTRSSLSFVTVKAGDIGEVHRFVELSGSVGDSGAKVVINLASVDTLIPIRDERMREILFEIASHPTATLSADVDRAAIEGMNPGTTMAMSISGDLTVKDNTSGFASQVMVAKLSAKEVLVAATQPIVVAASTVGLDAGVEKLREIAGLPSISQAVPVTFVLVFVDE
jgi:polyisoprenoid-binding protein YceI